MYSSSLFLILLLVSFSSSIIVVLFLFSGTSCTVSAATTTTTGTTNRHSFITKRRQYNNKKIAFVLQQPYRFRSSSSSSYLNIDNFRISSYCCQQYHHCRYIQQPRYQLRIKRTDKNKYYNTCIRLSINSGDYVMNNDVLFQFSTVLDPLQYHRMDVPTRGTASTHAIYGTLCGTGMIEEYQIFKNIQLNHTSENDGVPVTNNEFTVVAYVKLGRSLDGHEGVVHGGILALLIDDVLGFGYEAIGVTMAFTANLNVNYLSPVMAESNLLVTATLTSQEGRKLFWKSKILNESNEVSCEATSLYIIPRQATKM
jgi:uncharacterized protein (TIGR00369 family)